MAEKAIITADFATPQDVAARLRIPASRVMELRRLVQEIETSTVRAHPLNPRASRTASRAKKK